MRTQLPPKYRGQSPPPRKIFGPCLLWPNGWMHQKVTWYGGRPRPTRHCVRCEPSYPQETWHIHFHPIFGPRLLWPNSWMDEDAAWCGSRPRPRSHCTRRGPSYRERGTAAPLFSAHVYCGYGRPSQLLLSSCYCGQTAGCIKMPLRMEVGLSPGDFVLEGDPASSPKRGGAPDFRPTSIVAKRLHGSRCHLV